MMKILDLFRKIHRIFSKEPEYNANEQLLIQKVTELLVNSPELFSATWFNGRNMEQSVRSKNKEILIMIYSGSIIEPIRPKMTKHQEETIKRLIVPIAKRDSEALIERFLDKY